MERSNLRQVSARVHALNDHNFGYNQDGERHPAGHTSLSLCAMMPPRIHGSPTSSSGFAFYTMSCTFDKRSCVHVTGSDAQESLNPMGSTHACTWPCLLLHRTTTPPLHLQCPLFPLHNNVNSHSQPMRFRDFLHLIHSYATSMPDAHILLHPPTTFKVRVCSTNSTTRPLRAHTPHSRASQTSPVCARVHLKGRGHCTLTSRWRGS